MAEIRRISAPLPLKDILIINDDTSDRINKSMYIKQTNLSQDDEYYERDGTIRCSFDTSVDTEAISRHNSIRVDIKKKIKQYSDQCLNYYRIFSTVYIIGFIILAALSVIHFFIKEGRHNFILGCFEFDMDYYFPYLTNPGTFNICLLILFAMLLCILNSLIRNDNVKVKSLIINTLLFSNLSLGAIAASFIIGMCSLRYYYTVAVNICLSSFGIICCCFSFFKSKKKTFVNVIDLINENFFPSILLSLQCYMLLYNVVDITTRTPNNLTLVTYNKQLCSIIANIVYFCLGIFVLTFYQDIMFPTILIIIDTGMLTRGKIYSFYETLTSIIVVLFMFYATVLTIFKMKLKLFKLYLEKENRKSNV